MLKGIDVSNWQDVKDVDKKLNDCDFCFIKVSEGTSFVDKKAVDFVKLCEKHGVAVFLYHFCIFKDGNHAKETEHFLNTVKEVLEKSSYKQPVGLCLDVEGDALSEGVAVNVSLRLITAVTRACPIVYMSESQVPVIGKYLDTKQYGLWVAKWKSAPYPSETYLRIDPWTTVAFWQYWGTEIDLDVFFGNREQLEKYQDYMEHLELTEETCCHCCDRCKNKKCVG